LQSEKANFAKIETILILLKTELGGMNKAKEFVENIKKFERGATSEKQSYEDLVTIYSDIKGKKESLGPESRVIEDLYVKSGLIQDSVFKILQTEKAKKQDIPEFTRLQNDIKKFPIDMKEEQQHLEKALEKANKLGLEIKKTLFPTYQEMEALVLKYKKCPVFIKKGDELEKQYEELKKSYEKILAEGKRITVGMSRLRFDELGELCGKVDRVLEYKSDEETLLKKFKKDFFARRCEILQKQSSDVLLTFTALKNLFMELPTYKNEFRKDNQLPQLEEIREFLENQYRIAGDIVNEIKSLRDKESVSRFPTVHGFVDFTQELAEKRADFFDVSNPIPTPTHSLRFIDNLSDRDRDRDESSRDRELDKKKRGRPPKSEAKGELRDSRENSRMSKEDEREREKSQDYLKKARERAAISSGSQKSLKDSLISKAKEPERKDTYVKSIPPSSNIQKTSVGKSNKEIRNKRETAMLTLTKILENSKIPGLNSHESDWIAKHIIKTFPDTLVYNDTLKAVAENLRNVLRFKYIGQNLFEKKFEAASLRALMAKSNDDLIAMEKDLKVKYEGYPDPTQAIKKKPVKSSTENDLKFILSSSNDTTRNEKPLSSFSSLKFNDTKKTSLDQKTPLLSLLHKADESRKVHSNEVHSLSSLESETFSDNGLDCQEVTPPPISVKTLKKSVPASGPILYDPDHPTTSDRYTSSFDSPVLYDPDRPREITPQSQSQLQKKIEIRELPEETILKIFEGMLTCGKDITCPQVVPQLGDDMDKHCSLKISGKISLDRFKAYINKSLNNWEKKGEKMLSGWVESHIPHYQSTCDKIAQELWTIGKVGVIEYNESSKIFFLNRHHFPANWERPLGLSIKKIQMNSNPSLCYIIYHKPSKLTKRVQAIAPEVIPIMDDSVPPKMSIELKNLEAPRATWKDSQISPTWSHNTLDSKEDNAFNPEYPEYYQNQPRFGAQQRQHHHHHGSQSYRPNEKSSLNQKRGYDHHNNSGSKNDPRLVDRSSVTPSMPMEDPRKKLKLSNADKMGSSMANVNYVEKEPAVNTEDEEYMKKLFEMSDSEAAALAKNLDPKTREQIISKLKILNDEKASTKKEEVETEVSIEIEQDSSQRTSYNLNKMVDETQIAPKTSYRKQAPQYRPRYSQHHHQAQQPESLVYNPPEFIQAFYNLFTKEELEEAKEKSQDSMMKYPEPKPVKKPLFGPIINNNDTTSNTTGFPSLRQKLRLFSSQNQPQSQTQSQESSTKVSPLQKEGDFWNSNNFNNSQQQEQSSNSFNKPFSPTSKLLFTADTSRQEEQQQSPQFRTENLPRIEQPNIPRIEQPIIPKTNGPIILNNEELSKQKQTPPTGLLLPTPIQIENTPGGYDSPAAKYSDGKKTEERQSTPDFPKTVSRINETTTTTPFETSDIPVQIQLFQTPEPATTGRNEILGNLSFTMDSSFGDDVFVPNHELSVKVRNFNSILMEEELSPEGKSTVDTHAQRMSVESSTNKEEIAALLLKNNISPNFLSSNAAVVPNHNKFNASQAHQGSPVKTESFGSFGVPASAEEFSANLLSKNSLLDQSSSSDEFKAAMSAPKLEQDSANQNENINPYMKTPKDISNLTIKPGMMLGKSVVINKDQMTIPKELYEQLMSGNTNLLLSGLTGSQNNNNPLSKNLSLSQPRSPQLSQNNAVKVKQETFNEHSGTGSVENKQPNAVGTGNKINLKGLHQLTNLLALAKNSQLAANKKN